MHQMIERRQLLTGFVAGAIGLSSILSPLAVAQQSSASPEAAEPSLTSYKVTPGPGDGELTVTHAQGETVIPRNPDVVFSFDYASIDTLTALGIQVDGMPALTSGENPYISDDTTMIGSLFEPDYEVVNASQPDLIIVAARSSDSYEELSKIAPTIDLTFPGSDFVGDLRMNAMLLATIFGKEDEAEEILTDIDLRIEALREFTAEVDDGLVIMTSGGSVTALAPGNARAGRGALIYETLQVPPPLEDLETATHGEPVSFEFLLEHDPQWIFVIDRDAVTGGEGQPAEQVLDNDLMHQTQAWQEGRIVYLNAFDWYIITGAGLESMQRMLGELEAAFGL